MNSKIIKRSVRIAGHATSVSVEQPFWEELQKIADQKGKSLNKMIAEIDAARGTSNLSSAIRLYILNELKNSTATNLPEHP